MEKEKTNNKRKPKVVEEKEEIKEEKKEREEIKPSKVEETNKESFVNKLDNFLTRYKQIIFSSLITLILCLLLGGIFYNYYLKNLVIKTTKIESEVTVTDTGIADAVEKVYNAVVVVETYLNDRAYSTGTGFVFKTDDKYGYILTNYHVIDKTNSVKVTFTNKETVEAKIVGSDEYSDIAVLAVDKKNVIQVAQIAKSEDMRLGDTTFAVGAPVDSSVYSWSVTRGILSGKDRLVEEENGIMKVLQTDTAINEGNSGGPLCNSNGEVIGITNMKIASSSIEGMGFAIPIDDAIKYANSIIDGKKISRPYLGVSIYDANSFFNPKKGVFIESVEENSAADKAGFKSGDKIIKVNDVEVSNTSYFRYELYKYNIGDKIKITVERDGKEKDFNVTLTSSNEMS